MGDRTGKKGKAVFMGLTLAVVAAVMATVLLANDARHLRALIARYGPAALQADPAAQASQAAAKGQRLAHAAAPPSTPAPLLAPPPAAAERDTFVRSVRFPASRLCALFIEQGLTSDGWQAEGRGDKAAECTAERVFSEGQEEEAPAASLFAIVRGTEKDDIGSIRIKMVAPQDAGGEAARHALDALLEGLIAATAWSELQPFRETVARLEEGETSRFGLDASFRREFTNPDAFNLVIRPTEAADRQELERPRPERPARR